MRARFRAHRFPEETLHSHRDSKRTYALRGLSTHDHSGMFLLPPFALWTTFSSALVGRDPHDSLWWLCHLAARAV